MNLLLTSDGFENPRIAEQFVRLLSVPPDQARVLFIPTASRSVEELPYVRASREELIRCGIRPSHIEDLVLHHGYSDAELSSFHAIYVCGGNTFYLLHTLREYGVDRLLRHMAQTGVTYVGVSAGSVIAGPDIGVAAPFDENDVGLANTMGLGFIPEAISPHYQAKEKTLIDEYENATGHMVLRLKDGEALAVKDGRRELIGRE
jgi:dipeptidase E